MEKPLSHRFYTRCDVCGFKIKNTEAYLVTNQWTGQKGLVVCKRDKDADNPQMRLRGVRERGLNSPKVRSEPEDFFGTADKNNFETGGTAT